MNKVTMNMLINRVNTFNLHQLESGSNYFAVIGGRYNMTYIDVYFYDETGKLNCQTAIDGGTKKECFDSFIYRFNFCYVGKFSQDNKPNRIMAKKLFENIGVDFSADFHTLDSAIVDCLVVWAKLTKYRKPKNANGSIARYFFANLAKIKG